MTIILAAACALCLGAGQTTVFKAGGVASPRYIEETWLFCLDDSGSVHTAWPASPDSILEDQAGEIFKLDNVSNVDPDTISFVNSSSQGTSFTSEGAFPYASGTMVNVWWDLARLPAGITITSAQLCLITSSAISAGDVYGRYALFDTIKTDERWLTPETMYWASGQVRQARASWLKPKPSAGPWVPTFDNRKDLHDYGILSARMGAEQVAGGPVTFDVLDAVQNYVNYRHANAGFWLTGTTASTAASNYRIGAAIPLGRLPFLKVTFIRKPYRYQWAGKPLAICISTDDQNTDNLLWKTVADSFGVKYTLFCRGDSYPFASKTDDVGWATRLTKAQLQKFYTDGYEIGQHGTTHGATDGGLYGLGDITDADSMNAELVRGWLADTLAISPAVIRSFAYPSGGYNLLAIKAVQAHGYLTGRGVADTVLTPAWSDADLQQYLRTDRPRNLFQIACTTDVHELFGYAAHDTFAFASVKEHFEDVVGRAARYGQQPILFFAHDTKTRLTYADGMDPDDLGILLRLIQQNGQIAVMTMTEMAMAYHNHFHRTVDPPTWATEAIADGQVAADSIWWGN
jgi:hypothetical protein